MVAVPSLESLFSLGLAKEGTWDVPGILPGCPARLGFFEKFVLQGVAPILFGSAMF